jgi:starvation-inducible DNA-binding protein
MFDRHYEQHNERVDEIAARVQRHGGMSLAMAHDIAQTTDSAS